MIPTAPIRQRHWPSAAAHLGGVFAALVAPNLVLWCRCGQAVAGKLTTDRHWRVANMFLAALLVVSITPMWLE